MCDGKDNDCNLLADAPGGEIDEDNDGVMTCENDCDDNDQAVYPGSIEICGDGFDHRQKVADELDSGVLLVASKERVLHEKKQE